MDEIHDWTILKEILHKKDAKIYSLEEHIELLKARLWNEKLKNDNLDSLVRASDKNLTKPTED